MIKIVGGVEERVREVRRIGTERRGKDFCNDSDLREIVIS